MMLPVVCEYDPLDHTEGRNDEANSLGICITKPFWSVKMEYALHLKHTCHVSYQILHLHIDNKLHYIYVYIFFSFSLLL